MIKSICLISGWMLFLGSCTNKSAEVAAFTPGEDVPMERQVNVFLTYTDSAVKKMDLRAEEALNYPQLEEPKLEFPKGIDVTFFDKEEVEDSHLRSDYAIRFPQKQMWRATGNVEVTNKKGERLETELLIWDEKEEIIFSDAFVKMSTGNQVIMGEGFRADQNFTSYEINKVTGELYVPDDTDSTDI